MAKIGYSIQVSYNFGDPMKLGTPGPHFHYDFGDPSMNSLASHTLMGTPQFTSMFIVELEESAVAIIKFTGVSRAHYC